MTREEAIETIKDICLTTEQLTRIEEALECLLFKPSLPADIDKVVIPESEMVEWMKYGPHTNYPWCSVPDAIKITAEHFFALGKQAGAEWMAGQGETQEHFVIGSIASSPCGPAVVCYTEEFEVGDNVIVQIRKKQ